MAQLHRYAAHLFATAGAVSSAAAAGLCMKSIYRTSAAAHSARLYPPLRQRDDSIS